MKEYANIPKHSSVKNTIFIKLFNMRFKQSMFVIPKSERGDD